MKCVKCGKRLKSNENFCTYCGYYNSKSDEKNWTKEDEEEDLLDENWYDEDNIDEDDDEIVDIPKKEKKKKEPKPKKKKNKETKVKEIKIKEDNEIYDQNERYIEAYIGEDYKLIKKSPFNIWAFLLNWMYFLYRKLFITGIIGLIITALVAFFLTKYFIIYSIITLIILGFGFNKYYIFIIKRRVNKILKDYEGSDSFSLEKICSELGGVNIVLSLIIYFIFLVAIIFSIIRVNINTTHNTKFWKENSENQANCASLIRLTYNEEKANYDRIIEGLCKKNKNSKNYELYLKAIKDKKTIYAYYETENNYIKFKNNTELLDALNTKKKNNKITEEEDNLLNEIKIIPSNYKAIYKKSQEEDNLIKEKTNREEKLNYIFDYQQIIR